MTLHTLSTLAISAHAASVAAHAVTLLPRHGAQDVRRAFRAEREVERRFRAIQRMMMKGMKR